jgi:predicted 3-demethylubiquinone-9 3-methyltransferase (glyoxalase superfamily)
LKPDYAKWMLEDPRVNFAISTGAGHSAGISHLGIQAEDEGELGEIYDRLAEAERPVLEEKATTCCYAQSNKAWVNDPSGVRWETFYTFGEATSYGENEPDARPKAELGCCPAPAEAAKPCCAATACG